MPNIMNDSALPQERFVHVKNNGPTFTFMFASKSFTIQGGGTELMNWYLFAHARKSFDGSSVCPLIELNENEGSLEYARARAKQAEVDADQKITAAKEAAAEAEKAKKELAQARVAAREFDKEAK